MIPLEQEARDLVEAAAKRRAKPRPVKVNFPWVQLVLNILFLILAYYLLLRNS